MSPLMILDVRRIKTDGCTLQGSAACHAAQSEDAMEVQGLFSDQEGWASQSLPRRLQTLEI